MLRRKSSQQLKHQSLESSTHKGFSKETVSVKDWLNSGCKQLEAGNFEKAIVLFDKILDIEPDHLAALNKRGVALERLGKWEEALVCYDKVLELNPKHYSAWNNRSSALWNLRKFEDAIICYDKLIEIKPDDYEAWSSKGGALVNLERHQEALEVCDKAIEIKPDYYLAWSNQGAALVDLGRYQEAMEACNKALKLNHKYYLAWYNKGVALERLDLYEDALETYSKAIEIQSDYYNAWDNRGVVLEHLGRYEEALKSHDKAIEFNPSYYNAWDNRGVVLERLGRYEEALKSHDKAIELKPDWYRAWDNRGVTLERLGRHQEALKSHDKAIELQPDYYNAWDNRGIALERLGRHQEALESHDKAIKFKPDYYNSWDNRGVALERLGRHQEALKSHDKAIELKPYWYRAWDNRGVALGRLGRPKEALESHDKAIKLNPEYYSAWDNRGVVLERLGLHEEALESHDKAIKLNPKDYRVWDNRGVILERLGRHEEALESHDKAIKLNSKYYNAWDNRGVVLESLGRRQEALESHDEAIKLNPKDYTAWDNKGVVLERLGLYKEALESHDKAIKINPEYYSAWDNRGVVLQRLGQYEEAIASHDQAIKLKHDFHKAWSNRGFAAQNSPGLNRRLAALSPVARQNPGVLNQRGGYKAALEIHKQGLKYCQQEGKGFLYWKIGNIYYFQGKREPNSLPYWHEAARNYRDALENLTEENLRELRLEVMRDLIRVYWVLEKTDKVEELEREGTDLLKRLQDESQSTEKKKQLALKFSDFQQLTVNLAVLSGNWCAALELAEKGKNTCLSWLLYAFSDKISFPKWKEVQSQLLNPKTAIVYWHINPYSLQTFVLRHDSVSPIVVNTSTFFKEEQRLNECENWVKDWNQEYSDYRGKGKDKQNHNKTSHSWRLGMERSLKSLNYILEISKIEQHLEGITQLILIPHRDLHRFPLHALFSQQFNITYLPSAQLGIYLQNIQKTENKENHLLSVEAPCSEGLGELNFAQIESEAISQIFNKSKRIQGEEATRTQVQSELIGNYHTFHFTGHASYNFQNPKKSELALTGTDKLTLEDICQQNLSSYNLVSLSACETAVTGNQAIITEYVGLVSSFLTQGVAHVVSTLWTVESAASALIMIEFYRRWQIDKKSEVEALKEATGWLKNLTAKQLKKWYEDFLAELSSIETKNKDRIVAFVETELDKLDNIEANKKVYEHPYYWAGFTITGKL